MNSIITIRYIDALYFTEKKLKFTDFTIHIAMGKFVSSSNHLTLSFTEKNNVPETGLLVPKEAIIFENDNNKLKLNIDDLSSRIGYDIGIFWKDIVYFRNGKIPNECTLMYSEGKLFSMTPNALIIKNPITLKIKRRINNHPKEKTTFIVIPKSFIVNIEFYDKKL